MKRKDFLVPQFEDHILKRENYAVSLRKKKRDEKISKKRQRVL